MADIDQSQQAGDEEAFEGTIEVQDDVEDVTEDENDELDADDRSPEQQLLDNARGLLGLDNTDNGAVSSTQQQKKDGLSAQILRSLISAPLYPVKLVQVLIQLGYEPTAPERRYSFVFRRYLYYYPGVYGYAKHIVQQAGWRALYRGLGTSLVGQIVSITAHHFIHPLVSRMVMNLPLSVVAEGNGDVPDTEPQDVETVRAVLVQATRSFVTSLVTQVSVEMVVHPFNVIVVRTIAQHVGKESIYSGVWSSIREIYNEEGLSGFYAGLVPAVLGHAFSCLIYSSMWIFFEMVAINSPYNWIKMFVRGLIAVPLLVYIPRTYSYPFSLMSNVMAVNNTQLMAARQPAYNGWTDCYRDLKSTGALYRGSVVILPRFAYKFPPS